jgi:hypothetical protein
LHWATIVAHYVHWPLTRPTLNFLLELSFLTLLFVQLKINEIGIEAA